MKYNLGFMQGRLIKPHKKNIIQSFPDKYWFEEMTIGQFLFSNVEWTINIENINKNPLIKKNLKNNFLNRIKKIDLIIDSVTCDFFMQVPIFKKKFFNKKKKIIKYLKILIKNCEKLKIKYIILPLVDNSSIKNSEEENSLFECISSLEKELKKTYIIFEIDYNPEEVIRFIKNFDKKKFGINYDTGNSASLGYNISEEIKYFDYVKNIHIKDRYLKGRSVRLGKGDCNFKKFFYHLNKSNYNGNLILQTARCDRNLDIHEICLNKKFLEKFI
jgi:hexulose-6-phosphate isomerase